MWIIRTSYLKIYCNGDQKCIVINEYANYPSATLKRALFYKLNDDNAVYHKMVMYYTPFISANLENSSSNVSSPPGSDSFIKPRDNNCTTDISLFSLPVSKSTT